jgi:hypothetical protein
MADLGPKFYQKLLEISNNLGMQPEHLLNIMAMESGFNPSVGKGNSAVGLVQILPKYLSKLGFNGSADDFRRTPPEDQLIYIERLIRGNINAFNGGRPFRSLTQYYISNFLPACLKRADIQSEDPNAILASKYPDKPHIPNSSIDFEKQVYNGNAGLDVNKDGHITFGDLTQKLAQVAGWKPYRTQVDNLKKYTEYKGGYVPPTDYKAPKIESPKGDDRYDDLLKKFIDDQYKKGGDIDIIHQFNGQYTSPELLKDILPTAQVSTPTTETNIGEAQLNNLLDQMVTQVRNADKNYRKLYKKYLPTNHFVIEVFARDKVNAIEFSRILCSALDEELYANAYTCINDDDVEVQCDINGPEDLCYETLSQLTASLEDVFKDATKKIGGVKVNTNVIINKTSSYSEISTKTALSNYRKFQLKFA